MRLKEIEHGIYETEISGKPVVLVCTFRNRAKAEFVNNSVTVSSAKIRNAQKLSKESGAPVYVAVSVTVKGDWKQSFAIPLDLFKKHHTGQSDFSLTESARKAYAEDKATVAGFKPQIIGDVDYGPKQPKADKPAPETKPATEQEKQTAHVKGLLKQAGAIIDAHKWTPEEEMEIAYYQETEGLSRKAALQKIRRRVKAGHVFTPARKDL